MSIKVLLQIFEKFSMAAAFAEHGETDTAIKMIKGTNKAPKKKQ